MEFEQSEFTSSFGGKIEEIPNIYVDNFGNKNQMAYFLSHAHSDHTVGLFGKLNGEVLRRNGAKIYMSEETKTILKINHWHYNETRLYDIVEPLKPGMTYTIEIPDEQSFQVTMIPVTHMIGAVMFLFKTKEKTILYTGDFVIEEHKINELTKLHDKKGNRLNIDTMYVDATFDNDDYKHFPRRNICHNEVVNEIENWLDKNDRKVALFQNYQYGYDEIYKEIYRVMETKIFTQLLKTQETYRALYGKDNFFTEDSGSKIHVCENRNPHMSHGGCGVSSGNSVRYLHIYISAQRGCSYDPDLHSALHKETDQSLYLCYPTHCSKSQLEAFINYFRPKKTVKFPQSPVRTPSSKANTPYKSERNRRAREEGDRKEDVAKRRLNYD